MREVAHCPQLEGISTEAGEAWVEHADAIVGDDGLIDLPELELAPDERGNAQQNQAQYSGPSRPPELSALEA